MLSAFCVCSKEARRQSNTSWFSKTNCTGYFDTLIVSTNENPFLRQCTTVFESVSVCFTRAKFAGISSGFSKISRQLRRAEPFLSIPPLNAEVLWSCVFTFGCQSGIQAIGPIVQVWTKIQICLLVITRTCVCQSGTQAISPPVQVWTKIQTVCCQW